MKYRPTFFDQLPDNGILEKKGELFPYLFSEDAVIALDVALATDRPLLVSGRPGCGKSRLAEAVARVQHWNYLSKTITSRTRVEELTVESDHLRRLNDAQVRGEGEGLKADAYYHNPGIFWWAFNPESARFRGMEVNDAEKYGLDLEFVGTKSEQSRNAVLLIDEIDKAEPDLPNDLLEPLDRRSFSLPDGGKVEAASDLTLLTIITTNGERELPQAFLRRCVRLELAEPDAKELARIAGQHYPDADTAMIQAIAQRIVELREEAEHQRRRPPGTGEYLDAVRACKELPVEISEDPESVWKKIERAILLKDRPV